MGGGGAPGVGGGGAPGVGGSGAPGGGCCKLSQLVLHLVIKPTNCVLI